MLAFDEPTARSGQGKGCFQRHRRCGIEAVLVSSHLVATDLRKPAEVTASFRGELGELLLPLGFQMRAKGAKWVRKVDHGVHRVELGSSHHNHPGQVAAWISLFYEDKATRKSEPRWCAGGGLNVAAFSSGDKLPENIAEPAEARALLAVVASQLRFFDLLDDARSLLRAVSTGYVGGMLEPARILPYLRARLGAEAVRSYVAALLRGRPELLPAFVGVRQKPSTAGKDLLTDDHGTQLASHLVEADAWSDRALPFEAVASFRREARALRCFLGRLLRAWGEVPAAGSLRNADDKTVQDTYKAIEALQRPVVGNVEAATVVLQRVSGEARPPRRSAAVPHFFQYHAGHTTFADPATA